MHCNIVRHLRKTEISSEEKRFEVDFWKFIQEEVDIRTTLYFDLTIAPGYDYLKAEMK